MAKNMMNWGKWAFIAGIVLAIASGFLAASWVPVVLFVLGIVVGFLNVTAKEMTQYLVAIVALLLVANSILILAQVIDNTIMGVVGRILVNFNAFVAASGLVVAIRSIVALGKN